MAGTDRPSKMAMHRPPDQRGKLHAQHELHDRRILEGRGLVDAILAAVNQVRLRGRPPSYSLTSGLETTSHSSDSSPPNAGDGKRQSFGITRCKRYPGPATGVLTQDPAKTDIVSALVGQSLSQIGEAALSRGQAFGFIRGLGAPAPSLMAASTSAHRAPAKKRARASTSSRLGRTTVANRHAAPRWLAPSVYAQYSAVRVRISNPQTMRETESRKLNLQRLYAFSGGAMKHRSDSGYGGNFFPPAFPHSILEPNDDRPDRP